MHRAEVGRNWSLELGFLDRDLAKDAGRQAVRLNRLQRLGGTPFAGRHPLEDNPRRKVLRVDARELESSANAAVFVRLLEAYRRTEDVAVNYRERFHLDPFDTGGHTVYYGLQAEPDVEKTLVVCLLGRASIKVHDPGLGLDEEIGLEVGDALHIHHFEADEDPPTFAMWPNSVGQPMVLING